jgi:hypothetical protein
MKLVLCILSTTMVVAIGHNQRPAAAAINTPASRPPALADLDTPKPNFTASTLFPARLPAAERCPAIRRAAKHAEGTAPATA